MDTPRKRTLRVFRITAVAFTIIVSGVSAAVLYGISAGRENGSEVRALNDSIEILQAAVARQRTITDTVIRLSELAGESGYELAVDDVIRDHGESMDALKANLGNLAGFEKRYAEGSLLRTALAVVLADGFVLLAFVLFMFGRLSNSTERRLTRTDTAADR